MKRRRSAEGAVTVSLFPFLAVLVCTMGALLLLLVVVARQARQQAAREADQVVADEAELEIEIEQLELRIEQLRAQHAATVGDLASRRAELGHIEDHMRRLRRELDDLVQAAAELERLADDDASAHEPARARLAALRRQIDERRAELESLPQRTAGPTHSYAIVPYDGPHGTHRRPLYVECRADAVVLQPEGIVLTEDDFAGPVTAGHPLAAALRAAREHLLRLQNTSARQRGEPYPLLLVRPDGVTSYYAARAALSTWSDDFGYELIEADWQLDFGPADPQFRQVVEAATQRARQRQEELARAAPNRYRRSPKVTFRAAPGGRGILREGGDDRRGDNPRGFAPYGGEDRDGWSQDGTPRADGAPYAGGHPRLDGTPYADGRSHGDGAPYPADHPHAEADPYAGGSTYTASDSYAADHLHGGGPPILGGTLPAEGGPWSTGGRHSPHDMTGAAPPAAHGSAGEEGPYLAHDGGRPPLGFDTDTNAPAATGIETGTGAGTNSDTNSGTGTDTDTEPGGDSSALAADSTFGTPTGSHTGPPPTSSAASMGSGSPHFSLDPPAGELPPESPLPPSPTINVGPRPKPSSLAEKRGRNWALPASTRSSVPITRPIRIECHADRLLIRSEDPGSPPRREIALSSGTAEAVDELVDAIWDEVGRWGLAGKGLYWRPILHVDATPEGRPHAEELRVLLAGSGLDLRERPMAAAAGDRSRGPGAPIVPGGPSGNGGLPRR